MKYGIVIMDGAAGLPIPARGGSTSLELAVTPHLDAMAAAGRLGLARTVPPGYEASSACACMSVLGYDPVQYYRGRAGIEAVSLGVSVAAGEAVFRCNLVTLAEGRMESYSSGYIGSEEAGEIITSLQNELGDGKASFFPGTGYRHLLRLSGHEETLKAVCTPPHDISGKPVADYLPQGEGSDILCELMRRSEAVLSSHPVTLARRARGKLAPTSIWLFWGTGQVPAMPPFRKVYGISAAMTSGVDLLRGLAQMAAIDVLEIPGVTDGQDNDYAAQGQGALKALDDYDMVIVHIEAPDEAGHDGAVDKKVDSIARIDAEVIGRLKGYRGGDIRLLVMPDHPTPISARTHTGDPVPFLLWGTGITASGTRRFTEAEAGQTGLNIEEGHTLMSLLLK